MEGSELPSWQTGNTETGRVRETIHWRIMIVTYFFPVRSHLLMFPKPPKIVPPTEPLPTNTQDTEISSSSGQNVYSDFPVGIVFLFLIRNYNSLSRWSNVSSQLMQTLHVKLNSPLSKEFSASFQCKSPQHNFLLKGNRSMVDFLCSFSCHSFLMAM